MQLQDLCKVKYMDPLAVMNREQCKIGDDYFLLTTTQLMTSPNTDISKIHLAATLTGKAVQLLVNANI